MDLIYLDFAKAFDKVPHERLGIKETLSWRLELEDVVER